MLTSRVSTPITTTWGGKKVLPLYPQFWHKFLWPNFQKLAQIIHPVISESPREPYHIPSRIKISGFQIPEDLTYSHSAAMAERPSQAYGPLRQPSSMTLLVFPRWPRKGAAVPKYHRATKTRMWFLPEFPEELKITDTNYKSSLQLLLETQTWPFITLGSLWLRIA